MSKSLRRRHFLAGCAATGLLARTKSYSLAQAQTRPTITGVTWGGPWVEAWKYIVARQNAADVSWVLHEASTTAIVAKIKASWPAPPADFVNASEPTMFAMMREGWLEPLTQNAIPNLAHLPPDEFITSQAGEIVAAPTDGSILFWAYDEHVIDMRIEKPEDLLSPKLRGRILLNWPTIGSGAQLISLARARGGDERNIDPGFEFVKDLIKAKVVGSVVKTDVQIVNAFTTGEVAVGLLNNGNFHEVSKNIRLTLLNKVADSPTFKTFGGFESVAILKKPGNRKPVMDFLNFCLDASNNASYAAAIGALPTNDQAAALPELDPLRLHDVDERRKFGLNIDAAYVSTQTEAWNRKWELEIGPLL